MSENLQDAQRVSQALDGPPERLGELRDQHHSWLISLLVRRGAAPSEAQDLLSDLWGDCVPGDDDRPSLLEKYSGKSPLKNWLACVATHRLVDLRRRQQFQAPLPGSSERARSDMAQSPDTARPAGETALTALIRDCVAEAFARCSAEVLLMLRLVYMHGLAQRELCGLWHCHESKISRTLSRGMKEIQHETLAQLKRRDPWLELEWEDFLELCQTEMLEFLVGSR